MLVLIGYVLALPIAAWWRGYVAVLLWRWYVVPTFHLTELSVYQAAGLIILWSLISFSGHGNDQHKGDELGEFVNALIASVLYPFFFLLIGWGWKWLNS